MSILILFFYYHVTIMHPGRQSQFRFCYLTYCFVMHLQHPYIHTQSHTQHATLMIPLMFTPHPMFYSIHFSTIQFILILPSDSSFFIVWTFIPCGSVVIRITICQPRVKHIHLANTTYLAVLQQPVSFYSMCPSRQIGGSKKTYMMSFLDRLVKTCDALSGQRAVY